MGTRHVNFTPGGISAGRNDTAERRLLCRGRSLFIHDVNRPSRERCNAKQDARQDYSCVSVFKITNSMLLLTAAANAQKLTSNQKFVLKVIHSVLTLLALVLAWNCNAGSDRILPLLGALLFPEIYLLQWGVRKYALKSPGYCGNPGGVLSSLSQQ